MTVFVRFLRDLRVISCLIVLLVCGLLFLLAATLKLSLVWPTAALLVGLSSWAVYWLVRRHVANKSGQTLDTLIAAKPAAGGGQDAGGDDVEKLRVGLQEAIKTICSSKLGETSGRAALYELPWYMIIGNPAAGKSSAVKHSGLRFPFAERAADGVQGVGGTRNCDWFFTAEGILLDTAGRYAVHEEDRSEWLGFLSLLRRHRPKAPINGIIITVSISELSQNKPNHAIQLAKNLRERVQELTEKLEVFAPVYVVFTKMDLLAGFTDFFESSDEGEREQVWGATLPYTPDAPNDALAQFEAQFDLLAEGLKDLSAARMAMQHKQVMSPGLLTFPMEFVAIRQSLSTFVATLFEDNPFQFKPVFRGFYFTSALQEGRAVSSLTERMASRFGLAVSGADLEQRFSASHGFFLKNLFSRVIFADRSLVRAYASRRKLRLRYASFFAGVAVLAVLLGGWAWSYMGNQQLVANVHADLEKVARLEAARTDLAARLEGLEILQDRLVQLQHFHEDRPLALRFGLYQGDKLEAKLRQEYFAGINELMLQPVAHNLESFLNDVNAQAGSLHVQTATDAKTDKPADAQFTLYKDASPTNVEDSYNALKTYIMLANRQYLDPGHLNDQITRFWRGWLVSQRGSLSQEDLVRSAEKILAYTLSQTSAKDFPLIDDKLVLVDQSRDTLRRVVKGMPARERVYAEIRMRAAARFPAITVASIVGDGGKSIIAGSYMVPGAFTREAWEGYVRGAIREAASKETQAQDWVLATTAHDDLTLEGSPEEIQKAIVAMYKQDYVKEWRKFVQNVSVSDFTNFDTAARNINSLGDPALSPLAKLMDTVYRETSWDNPSAIDAGLKDAKRGFVGWFKQTILRQAPIATPGMGEGGSLEPGVVGREFDAISRVVAPHGEGHDQTLMKGYLDALAKLRSRLNQIKNAGDIGPGSTTLIQQTLEGNGSELADALKFVDEQMLNGVSDTAKATLRPMLVRPLMQSFSVLLKPAELEINRVWTAQVYQPFTQSLAGKYPFTANSKVEASAQEIAQVFGPDGAIAKFTDKTIGPLAVRRGDLLSARTWADMGLQLSPDFVGNFPRYVATSNGAAAAGGGNQTRFQIMPTPASGLQEYSFTIDGQTLRYRNGLQDWSNFVWPNPSGEPGVKIVAKTFDGRDVTVLDEPGANGMQKMMASAHRTKKDQGLFELSWTSGNATVAVNFRIISSPQVDSGGSVKQGLTGVSLPSTVVGSELTAASPASRVGG